MTKIVPLFVSVCSKGFKKLSVNCYKFFADTKLQFGPALRQCRETEKSHLLVLEKKKEEKILTRYLAKHYSNIITWRTAGRKVRGSERERERKRERHRERERDRETERETERERQRDDALCRLSSLVV